jgi:hypothetical protein
MRVVLLAAIDCRAGDVGRSQAYGDIEYTQWRYVRVHLRDNTDDDNPRLEDIEVIIDLNYTKAFKD